MDNYRLTVVATCYELANLSRRALNYSLGQSGSARRSKHGQPTGRTLYDGCVPLLPRIFTTNLDCSSKQHPFSAGVSQSPDAEEAAGGMRAPSGALLLELW